MYIEIFIFLILFVCYRSYNARTNKGSLPTTWPVLGMLPGLVINCDRIHQFVTNILRNNGGTFVFKGPWYSNMEMLVTGDQNNVHYILMKNFPNFTKGPEFKKIFEVLGDGIFAADEESWEIQRRTTKSMLNHPSFQDHITTTTWKKLEAGLIPILEHISEVGTAVDLQEIFQRFGADTTFTLVLGHDPTSLSTDFPLLPRLPVEKAFVDAEEAVFDRHVFPEVIWKLQRWLRIGKENKLIKGEQHIKQYLSSRMSLKRQDFKAKVQTDGLDMLTTYMRGIAENGDAPTVPEEVWQDTMLNLIFAGKDTLASALTWFFWLVSTNPAEEKRIREEILASCQEKEPGSWNFSTIEGLKKLIYLHGAICETLRLFPPIPFQHKAPVEPDILPSGHRINANTRAVLSFYSMGRMESIWGKDCLEFKPGRWITEQGRIKNEPSFKFTAFNAGPRSCLGRDMSFIQLKIAAAAIISRFHVEAAKGHPITPSNCVVLFMKHGFKVKVSNHT